eukprot:3445762-Rhodomonas_salina.1
MVLPGSVDLGVRAGAHRALFHLYARHLHVSSKFRARARSVSLCPPELCLFCHLFLSCPHLHQSVVATLRFPSSACLPAKHKQQQSVADIDAICSSLFKVVAALDGGRAGTLAIGTVALRDRFEVSQLQWWLYYFP